MCPGRPGKVRLAVVVSRIVRGLRKVALDFCSCMRCFSVDWWVSFGRKICSSCVNCLDSGLVVCGDFVGVSCLVAICCVWGGGVCGIGRVVLRLEECMVEC